MSYFVMKSQQFSSKMNDSLYKLVGSTGAAVGSIEFKSTPNIGS